MMTIGHGSRFSFFFLSLSLFFFFFFFLSPFSPFFLLFFLPFLSSYAHLQKKRRRKEEGMMMHLLERLIDAEFPPESLSSSMKDYNPIRASP